MATETELMESFEACRTCGICFLASSNFLRQMFATAIDDSEMMLIRIELSRWNIELNENDGLPQFICISCIHEFQKLFKFRRSCVDMQQQFRNFYAQRQENLKIHIKNELPDPREEAEENNCDFIYVDDLSDSEYDAGSITPFNIPHIPIKEELIEAAAVPNENLSNVSANDKTKISSSFEATQPPEEAHEIVRTETVAPVAAVVPPSSPEVLKNVHVTTSAPISQPPPLLQEIADKSYMIQNSGKIECKLCLHISTDQLQHRQHIQRIHEIKDTECHICGKKFKNSTPTRLKFHLKWHKISKHIKCAQCGFYCDSRNTLKEHVRAAHTKIECNICRKLVPSKKMKSHMRAHLNKTEWPCSYCDIVFNNKYEHEQHNRQAHKTEDNTIQENNINYQKMVEQQHLPHSNTNLNESLNNTVPQEEVREKDQHYYRQDLEIPIDFIDNNCYNLQTSLNDEEINTNCYSGIATEITPTDTDETSDPESDGIISLNTENIMNEVGHQFVCAQCTQTFATVEELCRHHKEHTIKYKFNCHICGKSFDLKFTLNRHLRKHTKAPF